MNDHYTVTERHEESIQLIAKELVKLPTDKDDNSLLIRFWELVSELRETTTMHKILLETVGKINK